MIGSKEIVKKIDAALAEAQRLQGITDQINQQFNDAVVGSLSGATQALADCIMGIEGADASQQQHCFSRLLE